MTLLIPSSVTGVEVACTDDDSVTVHQKESGDKTCEWVRKAEKNYSKLVERCKLDDVASICKKTCGTCKCADSIIFKGKKISGEGKKLSCAEIKKRVRKSGSRKICKKVEGAKANCQATCKDSCQVPDN